MRAITRTIPSITTTISRKIKVMYAITPRRTYKTLTVPTTQSLSFLSHLHQITNPITNLILSDPFISRLENGSLPKTTFNYYLQQDSFYLTHYRQCWQSIRLQLPPNCFKTLILEELNNTVLNSEQKLQHLLLDRNQGHITPNSITESYIKFLHKHAINTPIPVSLAALTPCYIIYYDIAQALIPSMDKSNPYYSWAQFYSSPPYKKRIELILALLSHSFNKAPDSLKPTILLTLKSAAAHERHFFNASFYISIKTGTHPPLS